MSNTTPQSEPGMEEYAAMRAKGPIAPQLAAPPPDPPVDPPPAPEPVPAPPAPEPDPAPPAEPPTPEPPAPAARSTGVSQRFSELTAQRDAALAELEKAVSALKSVREQIPAPPSPPAPAPIEDAKPTRPDRTKFDDPDAYDAAMASHIEDYASWTARDAVRKATAETEAKTQTERETAARSAQEAAQAAQQRVIDQQWTERLIAAKAKHTDFDQIAERDDLVINEVMAAVIKQHEAGPDIYYWLGLHPEEAARIANLTMPNTVFQDGHPRAGQPFPDIQRQLMEMGRVAALASTPATPATPPRAPRPPTPVSGNSVPSEKSFDEMTTDEYARATGRDVPTGSNAAYLRAVRN